MDRRSRYELRGSATPEEAAAVIAAIERFTRDTAPPSVEEGPKVVSPWVQTARLEGVDRDPGRGSWT